MSQGATNFESKIPGVRINKTWRDSTISTMTMNKGQIGDTHIPCLLNDFFKNVGLHYFGGVITVEVNFHFNHLDHALLPAPAGDRNSRAFPRNLQLEDQALNIEYHDGLPPRGETVLVTDRDRVIAEIGPPGPRSSMLPDALLSDALRQGWITPPISVGRGPPARKPVMTIDELLSNLERDRADR
jgi:hypothetical protein